MFSISVLAIVVREMKLAASKWGAESWLPRMHKVVCVGVLSQRVQKAVSRQNPALWRQGVIATTFDSKDTALAWLRVME